VGLTPAAVLPRPIAARPKQLQYKGINGGLIGVTSNAQDLNPQDLC